MTAPPKRKRPATHIVVYLAQPKRATYRGHEDEGKPEIAIVRGNKLLATRKLDTNVIELSTVEGDAHYRFTVLKKFL